MIKSFERGRQIRAMSNMFQSSGRDLTNTSVYHVLAKTSRVLHSSVSMNVVSLFNWL